MDYLNSLFNKFLPFMKKVFGISNVNPGKTVDLGGVDERFSGDAEVEPVSHTIDNADFGSKIETKRSEDSG